MLLVFRLVTVVMWIFKLGGVNTTSSGVKDVVECRYIRWEGKGLRLKLFRKKFAWGAFDIVLVFSFQMGCFGD
jgi:hypothetical protein